jgi:hypothetical protein
MTISSHFHLTSPAVKIGQNGSDQKAVWICMFCHVLQGGAGGSVTSPQCGSIHSRVFKKRGPRRPCIYRDPTLSETDAMSPKHQTRHFHVQQCQQRPVNQTVTTRRVSTQ